jgi:general stress protein 26
MQQCLSFKTESLYALNSSFVPWYSDTHHYSHRSICALNIKKPILMKSSPQKNESLTKLCKLIDPIHIAMLTVSDAEGDLTSMPMAPLEMDEEGAIWFFTDLHSDKVRHLNVVNLGFSDSDNSTYVSISGRGEIHSDRALILKLWSPAMKPWFPNGPESPNLTLLKIIPTSAEYWDAPDSKMVRMFAMAASIAANKPIGLGKHDTLTDLAD